MPKATGSVSESGCGNGSRGYKIYYFPYHAVFKAESLKIKHRSVFYETNGVSIKNRLLVGPKISAGYLENFA